MSSSGGVVSAFVLEEESESAAFSSAISGLSPTTVGVSFKPTCCCAILADEKLSVVTVLVRLAGLIDVKRPPRQNPFQCCSQMGKQKIWGLRCHSLRPPMVNNLIVGYDV